MDYLILILCSYLLGSIPFGLVLSWFNNKQDIRQVGTQNAGASNTFLVVGPIAGIITAILDIAKGFIPALFAWIIFNSETMVAIAGISAICGHIWPIFFSFKGGKGIATATGVLLFISWPLLLISLILWATIVFASRYVTLSNVIIYMMIPVLGLFFNLANETILYFLVVAIVIMYSHRVNISRFFQGQEPTIFDIIHKKKLA